MFKIAGIGELLWDLLPGGPQLGGAPANFASHACALGAAAHLISRVGDDELGRNARHRLQSLGLPLEGIELDPVHPTGTVSVALGTDGQPQFEIHENVAWDWLRGDSPACDALTTAHAVCFGTLGQRSEPARKTIRSLVAATPRRALRILDVNLRQPYFSVAVVAESLSLANVLKVNETELPWIARSFGLDGDYRSQIRQLTERYDLQFVAYTRGSHGSVLFSNGAWSEHLGVKTVVADTVGAGDAFSAAMTLGMLAGWPLDEVNRRANQVAAGVCSQPGDALLAGRFARAFPSPKRANAARPAFRMKSGVHRRVQWLAGCLPLILVFLSPGALAQDASSGLYREPFRPQFHFTPAATWMNDPNGLLFFEGEYHLFYQNNPFGNKWGHMSWGHAVSPDLLHWTHLPVALAEENGVMIFSGSAVVDWENSSGFGQNGKPPLVAVYTGHYVQKPLQNQHLAYSNDRGRTWTKYSGNPVLDIGERDFRDPKVFWHPPTRRWILIVAWPTVRKVRLYASANLKDWTHLSDFGPAGSTAGIWECPDLFPVPVEGEPGVEKWALVVNVGSSAPAGGSGTQYFVGAFDGSRFTLDPTYPKAALSSEAPDSPALWADFGPDFYAAVSWSDIPKSDGRRLWLGWMSNWQYANDVPTAPWRNAMSIPRALALRRVGQRLQLVQQPIRELQTLRGRPEQCSLKNGTGPLDLAPLNPATTNHFELAADLAPSDDTVLNLELGSGASDSTLVHIDIPRRTLTLNRRHSGLVNFHPKFSGDFHAPIRLVEGKLKLHLFVDKSSIEVFVNDGEELFTVLFFPAPATRQLALNVSRGLLRSAEFEAWPLTSAWPALP